MARRGHRLTRRRFLTGASGLALAGLGASTRGTDGTPPWSPGLPPAEAAAEEPRRGGAFRIPITANVVPWPPIGLIQNLMVNKSLFNGLVRYSPVDWSPQPDLAERWETSKDGLTWTFHLKDGVRWHDDRPFTAEDVKWTLQMYADVKVNSILRGNLEPVTGIEVVNPATIKLITKQPYSSLVELLCYLTFMLPRHLLAGQDFNRAKFPEAFIRNPVGTGPFRFGAFCRAGSCATAGNATSSSPVLTCTIVELRSRTIL